MKRWLSSAVIGLLIMSALASCTPDDGTDGTTTAAAATTTAQAAESETTEGVLPSETDEGTESAETSAGSESSEVTGPEETDPGNSTDTEDTRSSSEIDALAFFENMHMFQMTKHSADRVEMVMPAVFVTDDVKDGIEEGTLFGDVDDYSFNDDGSLSIFLTGAQHQAILDQVTMLLDETFLALSEGLTYFKDLEYNEDLTEFTLTVDEDGLMESDEGLFRSFMNFGNMYQLYNAVPPTDVSVTMEIVDEGSGRVIQTLEIDD